MKMINLLIVLLCAIIESSASNNSVTPGAILGNILDKCCTDPSKTINIQSSTDSFDEERELSDLINDLLACRKNLVPVIYGRNTLVTVKSSYYNIFMVGSYSSFFKLYSSLDPTIYDFVGRFVIVYGSKLPQMKTIIEWTIEKMCTMKILNVVAIVVDESSLEVHSYFSYQPGRCNNCDPVLMANISFTEQHLDYNFFPNRLSNMHGCTVKAGTYALKPFTIIETNANKETIYKGTEVDIIRTVAEMHNFSVEFHLPKNRSKWGFIRPANSTGLMQLIQNESVDLGFGSIGTSVDRNFFLKAGVSHSTSTFVFVVPPGRPYTSFEKLYKPFTTSMWKCLAVLFALGLIFAQLFFGDHKIVFLKLFKIENLESPLLIMWTQILGIPLPKLPKKNTTLAFAIGWMIIGLLVRTLYQGVMFKYLHSGVQKRSVQTVEEINSAGLHYYMYDVTRRFFVDSLEILERTKQLAEAADTDEMMRQVHRGDMNAVLVLPSAMVSYFNQKNAGRHHVEIGSDIVATYIVCIYYPKNSPFAELFDPTILDLQAFGILSCWRSRYGDVSYKEIILRQPTPITMESIGAIFVIWFVLLIICGVIFCIEVFRGKA